MDDDFDPDAYLAGRTNVAPAEGGDIAGFDPDAYLKQKQFGTVGQQAIAGLEGAAQGVIGPLAPALEEGLGITTGANIRARAEVNPVTHTLSQATGLVGSALIPGLGEASLAGVVGSAGEHAAALLPATVSKIVQTGVKASAEMAALTTSDELSKMVTGDPNQTLGSATINVGLSGLIGGAGGALLGSVSPLWQKTKNILGVDKLVTDFMGETKALKDVADPVLSATNELKGRLQESNDMWKALSESKPEVLQKAMPAPTPQNVAKVDAQIQSISDEVSKTLARAGESVKTKSAVPFLAEDFNNFQEAVTKPNATMADKFQAANELKTTLQGYAKWASTEEGTAKGALGKSLSNIIRPALEDTKVWGAAGDVQKVTNKAISDLLDATKDFKGQFTSKILGEQEVAPEKVQSLLKQASTGKLGRKSSALGNYLDATQKYADAINSVHLENGLEAPVASKLNPTPVLDHALNTEISPGVALARWANNKGASLIANSAGEASSGLIGGTLGLLVGHPLVGAWAGEKLLSPIFSALAKPLAENALDSTAAKGAVDYLANAIKGQKLLENGVSSMFTRGAEVLAKDLIPTQESRSMLERSLTHASQADNAINVGGQLAHYLPSHATAVAQTMAQASNYLNSLKPTQPVLSPLDAKPPIHAGVQNSYNRALDIAQQPLMVLKYAKDGTLLPQDVKTLNVIYPGLQGKVAQLVTNQLIGKKPEDIPYAKRVSLNLLMGGAPLDSTMSPQGMQAIINSVSQQSQQQSHETIHGSQKKASGTELKQVNKVNQTYATASQARALDRRS